MLIVIFAGTVIILFSYLSALTLLRSCAMPIPNCAGLMNLPFMSPIKSSRPVSIGEILRQEECQCSGHYNGTLRTIARSGYGFMILIVLSRALLEVFLLSPGARYQTSTAEMNSHTNYIPYHGQIDTCRPHAQCRAYPFNRAVKQVHTSTPRPRLGPPPRTPPLPRR
jgi:hypothetical protein